MKAEANAAAAAPANDGQDRCSWVDEWIVIEEARAKRRWRELTSILRLVRVMQRIRLRLLAKRRPRPEDVHTAIDLLWRWL